MTDVEFDALMNPLARAMRQSVEVARQSGDYEPACRQMSTIQLMVGAAILDLRHQRDSVIAERDEARRVARVLAETSRFAEGGWVEPDNAFAALRRYEAAEETALAYPDTTKKDSDQ